MKHMKLFMAATALLLGTAAQAQFTASTIAENTAGLATGVTKTTTDSRGYRINPGDPLNTLNVVAWDGGSPAVYYFVPGGATGSFALPAGATRPDVIISTNSSTLNPYMVITYMVSGNFICRTYSWTGGAFTAAGSVAWPDAAGSFTPSVNLDATANGDYAVVIGRSNGSIEVRTGTNASLPAPPAVTVATLPAGTGQQTDICVNTNPTVGTSNIHISYSNAANTVVLTRAAPFSTLAFGAAAVVAPAAASITYADPRIASPNTNAPSCPSTDVFSVIYDELNSAANYYYIRLYSVEATAGITNKVLSGGAAGFPSPAIQFSKRPVLTYNEKFSYSFGAPNTCSGALVTSWTAGLPTRSLVGEKLLSAGTIYGSVTYYDINNPVRTNCDYSSISSKYTADKILLAFHDATSSRVYYKYFSYAAATMRTMGNNTTAIAAEKDITVYPNPASDHIFINYSNIDPEAMISVHVTDMTGRINYTFKGQISVLQSQADTWFQALAPGMYTLQCNDEAGFAKTTRIVKQ